MSPLTDPGAPQGFQRKSRLWVPGDERTEKDSIVTKAKSIIQPVKRLLVPTDRHGKPVPEPPQPEELQYAVRFNHQQRRFHTRYAIRLRRRNERAAARQQRRLDEATFFYSSQHYDRATNKIVRFNAKGEAIPVIKRPAILNIKPRIGYLETNGPERLRKSPEQIEFELRAHSGDHVRAKLERKQKIDHLGNPIPLKPLNRRLAGTWAWAAAGVGA